MNNNLYLFCLQYHYNHIIDHKPICDYADYYTKLLYDDETRTMSSIFFKRLYNDNIKLVLKIEEWNIKSCENELKNNIKYYANKQKRRWPM